MSSNPGGFIRRTLDKFRRAWRQVRPIDRDKSPLRLSEDLSTDDEDILRERIRECLQRKGGDVSARARAAELGRAYLELNDTGRRRFLEILAKDFSIDRERLVEEMKKINDVSDLEASPEFETHLRELLHPPYLTLFMQFNALPEGVKFLVDLRADLLRFKEDNFVLNSMDENLHHLLSSWFDVGFLELQNISWDAPASLLEKLVYYEAVHAIDSWEALKDRLGMDRRCFGFFHPSMPDEPLIFIWVALVKDISDNIQTLLDESAPELDPEEANTAIFYSISNTQIGLRGVSLGNILIKQVVSQLQHEFPQLKTFATLSPIPGFSQYLEGQLAEYGNSVFTEEERKGLTGIGAPGNWHERLSVPGWYLDDDFCSIVHPMLMRECAHYLMKEKQNGRARDSVAHFHLSNGAMVERLNWLGDGSEKGMQQSYGLMVNYLYGLSGIEKNHESYIESGEITASKKIRQLANTLLTSLPTCFDKRVGVNSPDSMAWSILRPEDTMP